MSEDLILRIQPLTAAAFKPYGDVIEASDHTSVTANQGSASRFNQVASLVNNRTNAVPNMCVFRCAPKKLPFHCKLLERHPFSSQSFIPMMDGSKRYLIVVSKATEDDKPDVNSLMAFMATNRQGINYHAGCWHHPMIALDDNTDFACMVYENGVPDEDCQEHYFEQRIIIKESSAQSA
eukprot:CFRG3177T1